MRQSKKKKPPNVIRGAISLRLKVRIFIGIVLKICLENGQNEYNTIINTMIDGF